MPNWSGTTRNALARKGNRPSALDVCWDRVLVRGRECGCCASWVQRAERLRDKKHRRSHLRKFPHQLLVDVRWRSKKFKPDLIKVVVPGE